MKFRKKDKDETNLSFDHLLKKGQISKYSPKKLHILAIEI